MSLHKKATIVIYLVLRRTPTYVNAVAGYSIIAPKALAIDMKKEKMQHKNGPKEVILDSEISRTYKRIKGNAARPGGEGSFGT